MNLQSDDFELFGVPRRFAQERSALDARWKELQREAHPDRHAASTAAVQRQAMQWSVRINEAYQRIKDPLRREALEDAESLADVDALEAQVHQARRAALERCADFIDQQQDYGAAARQVRALMFIARFALDIERKQEQLGQ